MFGLFDCIGTGGDELVRGVVLVRGDEECAAEAETGFADRAAEGVFVGTTPTQRGRRGLRPLLNSAAMRNDIFTAIYSLGSVPPKPHPESLLWSKPHH